MGTAAEENGSKKRRIDFLIEQDTLLPITGHVKIEIKGHPLTTLFDDLRKEVTAGLADHADQLQKLWAEVKGLKELKAELDKKADREELAVKADLNELDKIKAELDKELKAEFDQKVSITERKLKADLGYVDTIFVKMPDHEALKTEVAKKADLDPMAAELAKKADKAELAAKATAELKLKADLSYVDSDFVKKPDHETMKELYEGLNCELAKKAAIEYVDEGLDKKVDKVRFDARAKEVDDEMKKKACAVAMGDLEKKYSATAEKANKELEVVLKEHIDFKASSSVLEKSGEAIVKKVAKVLQKYPTMKINVEGHSGCTCMRASAGPASPAKSKNKCKAIQLSNDRAGSVIEALKKEGCTNEMLHKGHGCTHRIGMAVKIFAVEGQ